MVAITVEPLLFKPCTISSNRQGLWINEVMFAINVSPKVWGHKRGLDNANLFNMEPGN